MLPRRKRRPAPFQQIQIFELHEVPRGLAQAHLALAELPIGKAVRHLDEAVGTSANQQLETNLESTGLNRHAVGKLALDDEEAGGRIANGRQRTRQPAREP